MFFSKGRLRKIFLLTLGVFISIFTVGCNAMKNKPAENYFSGGQLQLAQAIHEGDLAEVKSISGRVNLNKPGKEDMTLLFYSLLEASSGKQVQYEILSELVSAGADPVQPVPDMTSVAVFAAKSDSPSYLKALVDGGMSVNAKYRSTPIIFYTANDATLDNLTFLVERGANVNASNGVGRTALMDSIDVMQLDTVTYLLNHGANPNAVNNLGGGFSSKLEDKINNVGDRSLDKKLEEIRLLAIRKGMK